jgi:Methyltransferase domain
MLQRSVIDKTYIERCANSSDMNEHLPVLARYASECNHITECGVHYCNSSYAFAHALKHKKNNKLVQIDLQHEVNRDQFIQECKNENVNAIFYQNSSLTSPLETTDLLFIDTWHVYGQLKRELARWNSHVSKYIIMHDTTVDEWAGETIRLKWNPRKQSEESGIPVHEITKGLWPAIREFLAEHPEWKLRQRYINNHGLTILERISNENLVHEEYTFAQPRVFPISFAIPKSKIRNNLAEKTKMFGRIVPGDYSTYGFSDENSYYDDYASSVFGLTKRKLGWDCMRHYEILANGCIPYFENIDACPRSIMTHLPKELIKSAMKDIQPIDESTLTNKRELITKYSNELLEYTRNNLTTEKMASYILNVSGNSDAKSVLYLSPHPYSDYLRDLMLHGFKELFKTKCHDVPRVNHIYVGHNIEKKDMYGCGFSYSEILDPAEYRDAENDNTIIEDIRNKKYDIVVYGSLHRGLPYLELVQQTYSKDKIIMLCGEDSHGCVVGEPFIKQGYNVFIRELE